MTDVYVALRRLKRTGKPASIGDRKRVGPTFERTWADVDRLALAFPDRVTVRA